MPIITFQFPTDEEEEQARRFQVVKNYLRNIQEYVSWQHGGPGFTPHERLLREQRDLPGFKKIQRRKPQRVEEIKRHLWLGWGAEVQLRTGAVNQPAILPYTNAWGPVHAYYAVYMSMHALFVAMGLSNTPENHAASLNTVSELVVGRGLLPLPWGATCVGCPHIGERQLVGFPTDAEPDVHVELLANPEIKTFWPRYAKMLEKTREERLDKRFEGWKKESKRKMMYAHEKRVVAQKLPPTTIFDYYLRLRLRSNYRDVRSYVMSAVSEEWHKQFHANLVRVTAVTCLLLESLVVQHVGTDVLDEACKEFLGTGAVGGLNRFVESRRHRLTQ